MICLLSQRLFASWGLPGTTLCSQGVGAGAPVPWSWTRTAFPTAACLLQFPPLWQPGASCPLWLSEQLPHFSLSILQQVSGSLLLLETQAGAKQRASGLVQRGAREGTAWQGQLGRGGQCREAAIS